MPDMKKLQKLIDASAKANNEVIKAEQTLNKFCDETWGFAPGDRDLDEIIDSCMGGCGSSFGMSAKEFKSVMDKESNQR